MQAVVNIAGSQFKVGVDDEVVVPRLNAEPESEVSFDEVLMTIGDDSVGTDGGAVKAQVLEHGRDEKIIVFHKKRRKGFSRKRGHRQEYTKIRISDISA